MQRDRLNQTFECNLAIKEENELLKEQELLRMEFIERLEKKQDQLETEVSKRTNLNFWLVGVLQRAKL